MKRCREIALSELMYRSQPAAAGAVEMRQLIEKAGRIKSVFDWIEEIQDPKCAKKCRAQQPAPLRRVGISFGVIHCCRNKLTTACPRRGFHRHTL